MFKIENKFPKIQVPIWQYTYIHKYNMTFGLIYIFFLLFLNTLMLLTLKQEFYIYFAFHTINFQRNGDYF